MALYKVSLNDSSGFKGLFIYKYTTHKEGHSPRFWYTLQMFNVCTLGHPAPPPNRNPVQSRLIQTSAPYPAMWQFSVEKVADNSAAVRWSSLLRKSRTIVLQLGGAQSC
ncbi:hypothetical protein AVEN_258914-1 [Araneus ventricosus]|uniref:Uncharacterized protein n=1 Tax=Araneus ventricosus TaxID=182803 RepID=A0A4Y2RKK7_ARAVE|nr:hypothetical protein AVEN_258914-1 [Araneus ventricosus]